MTEVRTTSSTGGEKGVKAERYDLIPKDALDQIARVYAFGAIKYADHNWRKRYEWGKSYAALQRHLHAFWDGETFDEESGLPHLAHAGFHVFALLTWLARDGEGVENEFDDRWTTAFERRAQETAAEEEERLLAQQAALDVLSAGPPLRFIAGVDPAAPGYSVVHSSDLPTEDLRIRD